MVVNRYYILYIILYCMHNKYRVHKQRHAAHDTGPSDNCALRAVQSEYILCIHYVYTGGYSPSITKQGMLRMVRAAHTACCARSCRYRATHSLAGRGYVAD